MTSGATILAFDTSAAHCAAALLCDGRIVVQHHEEMARGQAERLMPLLQELLDKAQKDWTDLEAIAVGTGPGNFTGIRIGVSAARGLALGLGVLAIGVDAFDALDAVAPHPGLACVPAPRGQAYLRDPETGQPYLASTEEMLDVIQDIALHTPTPQSLVQGIARVAAQRLAQPQIRPTPLYIKPADAAPASDPPPAILDMTPEVHGDDA